MWEYPRIVSRSPKVGCNEKAASSLAGCEDGWKVHGGMNLRLEKTSSPRQPQSGIICLSRLFEHKRRGLSCRRNRPWCLFALFLSQCDMSWQRRDKETHHASRNFTSSCSREPPKLPNYPSIPIDKALTLFIIYLIYAAATTPNHKLAAARQRNPMTQK